MNDLRAGALRLGTGLDDQGYDYVLLSDAETAIKDAVEHERAVIAREVRRRRDRFVSDSSRYYDHEGLIQYIEGRR